MKEKRKTRVSVTRRFQRDKEAAHQEVADTHTFTQTAAPCRTNHTSMHLIVYYLITVDEAKPHENKSQLSRVYDYSVK